jgi:hypothetical protein
MERAPSAGFLFLRERRKPQAAFFICANGASPKRVLFLFLREWRKRQAR